MCIKFKEIIPYFQYFLYMYTGDCNIFFPSRASLSFSLSLSLCVSLTLSLIYLEILSDTLSVILSYSYQTSIGVCCYISATNTADILCYANTMFTIIMSENCILRISTLISSPAIESAIITRRRSICVNLNLYN